MIEAMCARFGIVEPVRRAALRAVERVRNLRYPAQDAVKLNVLEAFVAQGLCESDLAGSTGYGYDDAARAGYEALLARLFGAERALARLSIVSGTHAIIAALAACTPPEKRIVTIAGRPYDTLRNAICDAPHALVTQGILYEEVALKLDGTVDLEGVLAALERTPDATVFVQRSRGYAPRPSIDIETCGRIFAKIKAAAPNASILVDNCYGELVEPREPTHVGADLAMGSLIKNVGGSLAPAGAYVVGREDLVERVAARVYAPGLGGALGPTLGHGRALVQGLFLAPEIVAQSLRGLDFFAALFDELGFETEPRAGARRTDIVQAIRLGDRGSVERFAAGLQQAMPLNARFRPEPGGVPGYAEPVIMSSGSFIAGATIELSCDGPLREPFEVYVQGGIVAEHAYLGALLAGQAVSSAPRTIPA